MKYVDPPPPTTPTCPTCCLLLTVFVVELQKVEGEKCGSLRFLYPFKLPNFTHQPCIIPPEF